MLRVVLSLSGGAAKAGEGERSGVTAPIRQAVIRLEMLKALPRSSIKPPDLDRATIVHAGRSITEAN